MQKLLVFACVSFGCVSPDAPEQSTEEQAVWKGGGNDDEGEVIVVEGTWDACIDGHICWGDLDEDPIDWGDTGGGGGGGGGGADAEPYDEWMKIPTGEKCAQLLGYDDCRDCCLRNLEKVWWKFCDKQGAKKKACMKHVGTYTFPGCYKSCSGKPGDPDGTCHGTVCP